MVAARRILRSFLNDSLRICEQAKALLKPMAEARAVRGSLRAEDVRRLYGLIHTLKGSASMVPGAQVIVQALHQVEARLTTQKIEDSAAQPDWLELASQSIVQTHLSLMEMDTRDRQGESTGGDVAAGQSEQGVLIKTKSGLIWISAQAVVRVLLPGEIQGRQFMSLAGAWVPVLEDWIESEKRLQSLGVGVRTGMGQAVFLCEEIAGWMTRSEAVEQGAQDALELFASQGIVAGQVA